MSNTDNMENPKELTQEFMMALVNKEGVLTHGCHWKNFWDGNNTDYFSYNRETEVVTGMDAKWNVVFTGNETQAAEYIEAEIAEYLLELGG